MLDAMKQSSGDRRQVVRDARGDRVGPRDHLPPGGDSSDSGDAATPRPFEPGTSPPSDERAGAARGHETRGKVETPTLPHLEESEQGPK
jgi:hypothetical protein